MQKVGLAGEVDSFVKRAQRCVQKCVRKCVQTCVFGEPHFLLFYIYTKCKKWGWGKGLFAMLFLTHSDSTFCMYVSKEKNTKSGVGEKGCLRWFSSLTDDLYFCTYNPRSFSGNTAGLCDRPSLHTMMLHSCMARFRTPSLSLATSDAACTCFGYHHSIHSIRSLSTLQRCGTCQIE